VNDLFPKVNMKSGYNPDQVDEFFVAARHAYSKPFLNNTDMTPFAVRRAAFDLKFNGYDIGEVDAALDRLELALIKRIRDQEVNAKGAAAWQQVLVTGAQVLYGRLGRDAGTRFREPKGVAGGYRKSEVDAILDRIAAFFDTGVPLTAEDLRKAAFTRARGGRAYEERVVDVYLARATDILLGIV